MIRSTWRIIRRITPALLEVSLIVLLCYLYAGSPPPGKNEPHYLGKARQYWQPEWCQGDFFLESADAHEVFYWTYGWVTRYLSLPMTAWLGRIIVWTLFAVAWRVLLSKLTRTRGAALLSVMLFIPLVHYGHLAGEWLIGGIEAKGFAYPLVFLAIAKAVERRWWAVWPLLGIAASFHVLVGGWAVIAFLIAWWIRRRDDQLRFDELAVWLVIGGLFSLPGLIPALQLSANVSPAEVTEANITYAIRRLSHHLIFYRFAWLRIVSFCAVAICWWLTTRATVKTDRILRVEAIIWGSLVIAAAGFMLDILLAPSDGLRAGVLRYYWFRLSDIFVPMGLALGICVGLDARRLPHRLALFVATVAGAIGIGYSMGQEGFAARSTSLQQQHWQIFAADFDQQQIDSAWMDVCEWIRNAPNLPSRSVFLTPTRQQTFKWYAHRPDVVTWKDIPQDAAGINDWWQRRKDVYLMGKYPWINPEELANVQASYGVTHIVWPYSASYAEKHPMPDDVEQMYRNDLFAVYALPNHRSHDAGDLVE